MTSEVEDYVVTFQKSQEREPYPNEVLIFGVPNNWNDFSYKIRCEFSFVSEDYAHKYSGGMYIGFLSPKGKGKSNSAYLSLQDAINELEMIYKRPEDMRIRFFTMLPSMDHYRQIVKTLGPKVAQKILKSVNDLVYYKDRGADWFDEAKNSEVFALGFMRNSEPFFAYSNADSVLDGIEEEKFNGISQNLKLKFSLESFKNDHEINLNYDLESSIPKRINILIGKNGLGKSQALNAFCRSALQYKDKNISLTDKCTNGRPMINRLLAISTPGETQNTFPIERKKTQKLYYRRLNLSRSGRSKATRSINELLVQLARSTEYVAGQDRWGLFCKSLSKVLPYSKIIIPLNNGTHIGIDDLNGRGGEQSTLSCWSKVDINSEPKIQHNENPYPLSSGQLTFLKFALLCCLYIENGSFVLLDEPETHMHPNMISNFINLLDQVLEETGSLALIATHSAYFVREVAQDQVHVFKNQEQTINIVQPRLTTFGAPVDSISRFVFGDDSGSSLTEKLYQNIVNEKLSFAQVIEEYSDDISLSSLMEIRRRMEV